MRSLVKHVMERAVVLSGAATVVRRSRRDATLVLAYHNVVPDGAEVRGDLSLHLPQRQFAAQLDAMCSIGDVIPLSGIGEPHAGSRPRFVITFDDAYAGALSAGVDELRRRNLPATVFVAPGLLASTTWWDVLGSAASGAIPDDERNDALARFAGRRDEVLSWARARGAVLGDESELPRIGTFDDVRRALGHAPLTIGSHTWSHVNLEAVRGDELQTELTKPAQWLAARFGDRYVPWLSYPYGLFGAAAKAAAARAGYAAAVRVDGGWLEDSGLAHPFAVPRHNVPSGLSADGFLLRLSGWGR